MKLLAITVVYFAVASAFEIREKREVPLPKIEDTKKLLGNVSDSIRNFNAGGLFDGQNKVTGDGADEFTDAQKKILETMQGLDVFNFTGVKLDMLVRLIKEYNSIDDPGKTTLTTFLSSEKGSISDDDFKKIPVGLMVAFKKEQLEGLKTKLTQSQKKMVCKGARYLDRRALKKLSMIFQCVDLIKDEPLDDNEAANMIDVLKEEFGDDVSKWTQEVFEKAKPFLAGLSPEDVVKIPDAIAETMLDKLGPLMKNNEKAVEKIRTAVGGMDKINADQLKSMAGSLRKLPPSDFKKVKPAVIKESVDKLVTEKGSMGREKRREVFDKLKEGFQIASEIPDTVSSDDIAKIIKFNPKDRDMWNKIPDAKKSAVKAALLTDTDLEQDEKFGLVEILKEKNLLGDLSTWDQNEIVKHTSLLGGLGKADFETLNKDTIKNAITANEFQDTDLPRELARKVVDAAANLEISSIQSLGKQVKALRSSEIKDAGEAILDNDIIMNNVVGERKEMSESSKQSFFKLIREKGAGSTDYLVKLGDMLEDAPIDLVEQMTSTKILTQVDEKPGSLKCKGVKCLVLYKNVRDTIGEPGVKNAEFNVENVKKLGSIMCGMSLSDIEKIPTDENFPDILSQFSQLHCLNQKQGILLATKAMAYFGLTDGGTVSLTKQQLKYFGKLVRHLGKAALEKMPTDMCPEILIELAQADYSDVSRSDIGKKLEHALSCLSKATGVLSRDDIKSLGNLACFLPANRIDELTDADTIEDLTSQMNDCPSIPRDALQKRKEKFNAQILTDYSAATDADITLGARVLSVDCDTNTDLNDIPTATLASAVTDFVEKVEEGREKEEMRQMNGFGDELPAADAQKLMAERKCMALKGVNAKIQQKSSAQAGNNRRKRATDPITCDSIRGMKNLATALSVEQLKSLTVAEFKECTSTLGAVEDWSKEQIDELILQAKAAYGSTVSAWTKDQHLTLGSMAQALTTTEIESISAQTLDIDVLSHFGSKKGWEATKLESVFKTFLAQRTASTLTGVELSAMGHFVCGLTDIHISGVTDSAFKIAVENIGNAMGCSDAKKQAYVTRAKSAYDTDVAAWDPSTVSALGHVLGGLTGADFAKLTEEQISSIGNDVIALLPASTLSGLTAAQAGYLSPAQANSFTDDQKDALPDDVKSAVNEAAVPPTTDNTTTTESPENSGYIKSISTVLFGIMVIISLSFTRDI